MLLWGWRLPFLTSTLSGLLALYMRRDMPEPQHVEAERQRLKGLPQHDLQHQTPSMVMAIDNSSSANKLPSRPGQQLSGSSGSCHTSGCTAAKQNAVPLDDQQQEHG